MQKKVSPAFSPVSPPLCLVVPGNYRLEIEKGFDPSTLSEVIQVLRGAIIYRSTQTRVYLALGSTDMRKAINGLSMFVQGAMNLDPFSGHLFVFCNRRHTILKVLY